MRFNDYLCFNCSRPLVETAPGVWECEHCGAVSALPPVDHDAATCDCDLCRRERFEFLASSIDQHGLCPVCGTPIRVFENEDKTTHTCDACGYHDVTFKWITD